MPCLVRTEEGWSGGSSSGSELGGGIHGGCALAGAQARGRSERGDGERRGSEEGDGEGVLVPLLIGSRAQGVHDAWSSGGEHGIRVSPIGPAIEHLARAMEPEFRHVFQHIRLGFGPGRL